MTPKQLNLIRIAAENQMAGVGAMSQSELERLALYFLVMESLRFNK